MLRISVYSVKEMLFGQDEFLIFVEDNKCFGV